MEVAGGIVAAGEVIIATFSVSAVLHPHLLLQIVILLWGIPPAIVGFGCGTELVAKMTNGRPPRESSWKWAENRYQEKCESSI